MRAHIESTEQMVRISPGGIEARVWCGVSEAGTPFQCLIPSVAIDAKAMSQEFDAELKAVPHHPALPKDFRAYADEVNL